MAVKNLAQIAKKNTGTTKVQPVVKQSPVKSAPKAPVMLADVIVPVDAVPAPVQAPAPKPNNVSDVVNGLLQDINMLTAKPVEEVVATEEVIVDTSEERHGNEWLEEQIQLLTQESDQLRDELMQARNEYDNLYTAMQNNGMMPQEVQMQYGQGNDAVKMGVLALFNELQQNLLAMGVNQETGVPNFQIYPVGFLNRMMVFFPFLENEKRY